MTITYGYKVEAHNDGELAVSVKWDSLGEALDSFISMVEGNGTQFTAKHVKHLLSLMLGGHRTEHYQVVGADERIVFSISKI